MNKTNAVEVKTHAVLAELRGSSAAKARLGNQHNALKKCSHLNFIKHFLEFLRINAP
jgi:hypothetical protein